MMISLSVTSVKVVNGDVYLTLVNDSQCTISRLRTGGSVETLTKLPGSRCLIIGGSSEGLLVSSGENLYLVSGNEAKPVLRARPGNWFWHAVEGDGKIFVHEYGESPTGIYVTEDLRSFEEVSTNIDVDPLSRHFHYLAFDDNSKLLIATLGDGNVVRVAVSRDYGYSWKPLYKGPWQFVPILFDSDKWILGFDSGIARGGVGVYNAKHGEWSFSFLKNVNYHYAQFASLIKFGSYYVGCLGLPTAITVSTDLRYWHSLFIDGSITKYNHLVSAELLGERIIVATGRKLLIFNNNDVEQALREKPFLVPYKAYLDKVKGLAFTIKRIRWILRL
jgi:hypothetical protein